jgi:uncharacterized phiE125 gp8 family phage protein
MPLPTVTDLKAYLRIETTTEDALLSRLLTAATQYVEGYIGLPVSARTFTYTAQDASIVSAPSIVLPHRPVSVTSIVDGDGVAMAVADYRVDAGAGIIYAATGLTFWNMPYVVTYGAGLSLRADYPATEAMVGQVIIDVACELYQQRTPRAASETGAGTSISWDTSREMAARTEKAVRHLRLAVAS